MLDDSDQAVIDIHVDHCGSSDGADIDGALQGVLALFDLDEMLATG